jgi:hypothetical protein
MKRVRIPLPPVAARLAAVLAAVLATPIYAAIDGTVINATTGKPAAGIAVSLIQPGENGMQPLADTKSDAHGKFSFSQDIKGGPAFVQATFQGTPYMKMLTPGTPTTGVEVPVFESTTKDVAKVQQHMILLQPGADAINVSETILYQGDPKLTYNNGDAGTIRFYVPPEAKDDVKATIGFDMPGGNSIPIQRQVDKSKTPNVYKIDYPIKPGETRVDITYSLPASPLAYAGKILHKEGKTRLVVPNGVEAKGDSIVAVGREPQTQATVYDVNAPNFKVELTGTGALQAPQAESGEDAGQPQIIESPPPVYSQLYWIAGLIFAVLALGTLLLLKNKPLQADAQK